MDAEIINKIIENLNSVGHFLFESYLGIGILIGGSLLLTFLIALILEFKTHDRYKNHPIEEDEMDSQDE